MNARTGAYLGHGIAAAILLGTFNAMAAGPDGRGMYGGGRPVTLADIPEGPLRKSMGGLEAGALRRAEGKLTRMTFHKNDLASLRASKDGSIYYVCAFTGAGEPEKPAPLLLTGGASVPVSSPPIYHSRTGAVNVLFLDFNGHVISNTQWNASYGVPVWRCKPFDIDGDTNTFSEAEQQYILEIWQRVAEDYAPFNVDVTTEQPAAWTRYTGHALITPETDAKGVACPHNGYGGIAYFDVFGYAGYSYNDANCYSPVWVLPSSVFSYSCVAEAASHELGHNVALNHDGTLSPWSGYYGGHAGSISWGPIMGTGYGCDVSQWCKGDYYNANEFQDDLAIIAARLAYRPDDFGDSIATASVLPINGIDVSVTGMVETTGNPDVFSFTTGLGVVTFTATTYRCASGTWGGNVDLALMLKDVAGTVLASNTVVADTYASVTATVAAGIYYLEVRPTGVDTPLVNPPSGYTDYGSLGQYLITGRLPAEGSNIFLLAPNLSSTYYTGGVLQVQWESGLTNNVRIELLKNNSLYLVLATNSPSDGIISWTIPANTPMAATYTVRVSDSINAGIYDVSDSPFTVKRWTATLIDEPFNTSSWPSGWTSKTNKGAAVWEYVNGGYYAHPAAAHSAPYNARLFVANTSDNIVQLISPSFSLVGFTNATLVFWYAMAFYDPDQDKLAVLFRTNATAAWTTQAFYTANTPDWTEKTISLTKSASVCAIAFEGNAKYGYGVCVDDVRVTAVPLVPPESSDSDIDGLPDGWEAQNGLNPVVSNSLPSDSDSDGFTDFQEYVADTHPSNNTSKLEPLTTVAHTGSVFWISMVPSSTGRVYDVWHTTNLIGGVWQSNGLNRAGNGGVLTLEVTNASAWGAVRCSVRLPP